MSPALDSTSLCMVMKIDGVVHAAVSLRRQSGSSQQGSLALKSARMYFRPGGINVGHICKMATTYPGTGYGKSVTRHMKYGRR